MEPKKTLIILGPGGIGKSCIDSIIKDKSEIDRVDPYRLRQDGPRDKDDILYAPPALKEELEKIFCSSEKEEIQCVKEEIHWYPEHQILLFTVRKKWQLLFLKNLQKNYSKAEVYAPVLYSILQIEEIKKLLGDIYLIVLNPLAKKLKDQESGWESLKKVTKENCKERGDKDESLKDREDSIEIEAPYWIKLLNEFNGIEITGWEYCEYRCKQDTNLLVDAKNKIIEQAKEQKKWDISFFFKQILERQKHKTMGWGEDNTIDNETLMIGFSYSLDADGSYGWYNELIANKMAEDISCATTANFNPWVGVQWEIYDAISTRNSSILKMIPRCHVAQPPSFTEDDICNPEKVDSWLARRKNAAGNWAIDMLRDALEINKKYFPKLPANANEKEYKAWLAAWLNTILEDDNLWRKIANARIQLSDGIRILRDTFTVVEERKMPDSKATLTMFQRRRVNRLMIDTLCNVEEAYLRAMPYLSTQGVLNELLQKVENEGREIIRVRIYGNPVHVERCAKQFFRTASQRKWPISRSNIYVVMVTNKPDDPNDCWNNAKRYLWEVNSNNWKEKTAQEWCRSLESWNAYNQEISVLK